MREGVEDRPKDRLGAERGDGHSDLPPDFFRCALEFKTAREGLKCRPFRICQRTVFAPVVNMCAAAARACERVGGTGREAESAENIPRIQKE